MSVKKFIYLIFKVKPKGAAHIASEGTYSKAMDACAKDFHEAAGRKANHPFGSVQIEPKAEGKWYYKYETDGDKAEYIILEMYPKLLLDRWVLKPSREYHLAELRKNIPKINKLQDDIKKMREGDQ